MRIFVFVTLFSALSVSATAQTCDQVEQNGVTFTFDRPYSCGQFANGDVWVAPSSIGGAVTIDAIDPAFDGIRNGWEVNPSDPVAQGFDDRIGSFDAARVPALPYAAHSGESIVKGVSVAPGTCRPCLVSATILTVLESVPVGGGTDFFRPPYPGTSKPLIDIARLRLDLLPSLPAVASTPSLTDVAAAFEQPWLDHKSNWVGRPLHPINSMPDYGAAIARRAGDGVLALMVEGDPDEKLAATVRVVQVGLDLYAAYQNGSNWPPNGGHSSGRRILMALAATLLDDAAMTTHLRDAPDADFGEDGTLTVGADAGIPLWGHGCAESTYWNPLRFGSGPRTCADPYGIIDGSEQPGGSYQYCCNSSPWRGSALALRLVPALQCAWPAETFLTYVDRWVALGTYSQPDPCAPYDGDPDNYGITYGPDGAGSCIVDTDGSDGIGRFPDAHGTGANGGGYSSPFHGEMWAAYRATAGSAAPVCGVIFADGFEGGDLSAWTAPR